MDITTKPTFVFVSQLINKFIAKNCLKIENSTVTEKLHSSKNVLIYNIDLNTPHLQWLQIENNK